MTPPKKRYIHPIQKSPLSEQHGHLRLNEFHMCFPCLRSESRMIDSELYRMERPARQSFGTRE